jgi:uncharacterized protein
LEVDSATLGSVDRSDFAGRHEQLALLDADLAEVGRTGRGRFALIRGRRQVGKSRLIEEFIERTNSPAIFFTATKGRASELELKEFTELMKHPSVDPAGTLTDTQFNSWDAAMSSLSRLVAGPTVVVIDEFPYLAAGAPDVEGAFQKSWDRSLKGSPILLVVVGSDLAMMEALTEYGRPLYGRPNREIHLRPLDPYETATLTGLKPIDAFDAYLVTGGFPNLVNRWRKGHSLKQFLATQLASSTEVLSVAGERMMAAEFPADSHARIVLSCIASGVPTFNALGSQTGLASASLDRALKLLVAKQAIAIEQPISGGTNGRETRYRIADTYLAFWSRFIEHAQPLLDRGRTNQVLDDILRQWPDYRGRAIEPIVRESVARLLPINDTDAHTVGSYWTRDGRTELDLVGIDGQGAKRRVSFVGSIKWRQSKPFSGTDASKLAAQRALVPGTDERTTLVAVSSSGFDVRDIPITLSPSDLLNAWAPNRRQ